MTDRDISRYIELEEMNFKGYREYDEMAALKKDIHLFDIMRIEAFKSGNKNMIIESIGRETLKKYVGSQVDRFIKTLVDGGWAKEYEYRKYGRFFYGITLTETPRNIYYELY